MATASITATTARTHLDRTSGGRVQRAVARSGIAAGALLAAAIILPSSLANWAGIDHPQLAAQIAPWSAPAAADAAAAIGGDPRKAETRALVRKALARDVSQVEAIELRALDLAVSGNSAQARRLFQLSDQLSRRSLPTRLWLIQDSVDRGDVAGALRNFDIALRTSVDAQPILFPVLARALADPTLSVPLALTLDRPSDWRLMFFNWAIANRADLRSIAAVVVRMRDSRFVTANGLDQHLIDGLVNAGAFTEARQLNRRFGHPSSGVADPDFADSSAHYPFGWGLVSNGSLGAERSIIGSTPVLTYRAAPANSGQVAAQLLTLPPGRYALVVKSAAAAVGPTPFWSLVCGPSGPEIARIEQPAAASGQATALFMVPGDCAGQWLTLRLRSAADSSSESGAIASVSLVAR